MGKQMSYAETTWIKKNPSNDSVECRTKRRHFKAILWAFNNVFIKIKQLGENVKLQNCSALGKSVHKNQWKSAEIV